MAVHTALLRLQTEGDGQIVDLTPGLAGALRSAGVTDGVVTVFVTGSTAAITTMEYEPGGVQDLTEALERLVPQARPEGGDYAHNTRNHDDNAHSHLRASLRGAVAEHPARAREPRAGHLAAGRTDRFRRPPAGALGARADSDLTRATFRAAAELQPSVRAPYGSATRRAILRCPLWEPTGCPGSASRRSPLPRKARRSLKTQQHAHLTAGFGRSSVCVQVRSAAGFGRAAA